MKYIIGMVLVATLLIIPTLSTFTSAGIQLNPKLAADNSNNVMIQKIVISMHIPDNAKLPFGSVWGTVTNAAPGYPVVIEIFKSGKPIEFGQTDVNSDGTYNYYFRIFSVIHENDGHDQVIHIFSGDYTVEIFKAVTTAPLISMA